MYLNSACAREALPELAEAEHNLLMNLTSAGSATVGTGR